MTKIHSSSPIWRAIIAATTKSWLDETLFGLNFNGELINEDKIILWGEESKGLSTKNRYQKKDGVPARLLAKKAVTALRAGFSKQRTSFRLSTPCVGLNSAKLTCVPLATAVTTDLAEKLSSAPKAIGFRYGEQITPMDGIKAFLK